MQHPQTASEAAMLHPTRILRPYKPAVEPHMMIILCEEAYSHLSIHFCSLCEEDFYNT